MEPPPAVNGQAMDHDMACPPDGRAGASTRERALDDLLDAVRQLQTLSEVRAERARLRASRMLGRWTASAGASLALGLLAASGAVLAGIGVLLRMRAMFADQPGVGEMLSGALFLFVALGWAWIRKSRAERALIQRLEARHGAALGDGSQTEPEHADHAR